MDNWQTKSAEFAQKHNLSHNVSVYVLDLVSEVGEVAKEILKATNYGAQATPLTPQQIPDTFAGELGDVLYSLCSLATSAGIDLDDALTQTLQKYEQRQQQNGAIGSQPSLSNGEIYEQ